MEYWNLHLTRSLITTVNLLGRLKVRLKVLSIVQLGLPGKLETVILTIDSVTVFFCRPYFLIPATNFIEIELRQKRSPVGGGPSLNRCPRCAPHLWHITSVLVMPAPVSIAVVVFRSESGAQKLGQPVPESYLVSELNR